DQLGRQRSDDVHPQDLAELRVTDDFHKTIMRADDGGARVAGKGELADLDLPSQLFGFRLGQTNAADLSMTIRRAGNAIFADGLSGFDGNFRERDHAAHGAGMCELRYSG